MTRFLHSARGTLLEAELACHPGTPCAAVGRATVRLDRTRAGRLTLTYRLEADTELLRVPAARVPRFADGLWRHTCCEVLVARKGAEGYHEFNFSPSGEWAAYAFERYRLRAPFPGAADALAQGPPVTFSSGATNAELRAAIDLGRLSPDHAVSGLALSLAMVVEDREGALSYWALRHQPGRPDFHHPRAFALEVPPVAAAPCGSRSSR